MEKGWGYYGRGGAISCTDDMQDYWRSVNCLVKPDNCQLRYSGSGKPMMVSGESMPPLRTG